MKKTSAKTLSALLLAATLAACGETSSAQPASAAPNTAAADETAAETETEKLAPDTSNLDFGGKTVTFIVPDFFTHHYQYAEELNGETLNDAVYNRKVNVENALNVKINWIWGTDSDTHSTVLKSVAAGEDAYQIAYTHSIYGIGTYATEGALFDLNELQNIDFSNPWWNLRMMEDFRIGRKLLYAAGDLILHSSTCMLFNKTMAKDYAMPDHYQLVRDGLWTYDRFIEYASSVTVDINGDGAIDKSDQTGCSGDVTERFCDIPFWCGVKLTERTDDGLKFVFWNEKYIDIYEKTFRYFLDTNVCNTYFRAKTSGQNFSEGLSLYTLTDMAYIANMRSYDVDFGVIPGFKYNEEQESYYSYSWPCFTCVPTTIQDPELVGAVYEQFCYESTDVLNAYTENLIRGKSTRDVESLEMLDILKNNMVCDIAASYLGFESSVNKFFYCFSNMIGAKKEDIASYYEKNISAAEASLEKLYDQVNEAESL